MPKAERRPMAGKKTEASEDEPLIPEDPRRRTHQTTARKTTPISRTWGMYSNLDIRGASRLLEWSYENSTVHVLVTYASGYIITLTVSVSMFNKEDFSIW
jgi:hypothetical protein